MSDFVPARPGQLAATYIEKKWGAATRGTPLTSLVLAAGVAGRLFQNNPRRMLVEIFNPSTGNIYIGNTSSDATSSVILVAPLGGSAVATIDEDGESVTYEWWVYSAGGATVYGIEVGEK